MNDFPAAVDPAEGAFADGDDHKTFGSAMRAADCARHGDGSAGIRAVPTFAIPGLPNWQDQPSSRENAVSEAFERLPSGAMRGDWDDIP